MLGGVLEGEGAAGDGLEGVGMTPFDRLRMARCDGFVVTGRSKQRPYQSVRSCLRGGTG